MLLHHTETFTQRFDTLLSPKLAVIKQRYKSRSRVDMIPDEDTVDHDHGSHVHYGEPKPREEASWDSQNRKISATDSELFSRLLAACSHVSKVISRSRRAVSSSYFGIPPLLSRGWTLSLIGVGFALYSARKGYTMITDFLDTIDDTRQFLKTFAVDWVINPIRNIYNTIRFNNIDDSIVTERALQVDIESLSRMVENWNLHHDPKIDPALVHKIGENARLGDISSIMKAYESAISAPIRNALLGDFLELILIQVQKQKVDAEKAVIKLDRLLQQNELNFQLFAAIPAISVLWGLWKLVSRETHPYSRVYHQVRDELRSVSVLLNRNNIDTAVVEHCLFNPEDPIVKLSLSFEQFGMFAIAVVQLQRVASFLPPDVKDWFVEDLHELSYPQYGVKQRLATVARMYGTYGFLSGLAK